MPEKIPKVLVLGAIRPTVESSTGKELRYGNLVGAVEKHRPHERARQKEFWETDPDSTNEEQAARQLAMYYMLETAIRASNPTEDDSVQRLWAERYTNATKEIYGEPYTEIAEELLEQQSTALLAKAEGRIDGDLLEHYRQYLDRFAVTPSLETEVRKTPFEREAAVFSNVLDERFSDVFEELEAGVGDEPLQPTEVASRFERAIEQLASHDPAWREWSVERNDEKNALSVNSGDKKVLIGLKRAAMLPGELRGLFAHEVLLHAQRAVNGAKYSPELKSGLPGYIDAEEGVGVFFEYAVSGRVPEKNVDRYIDIALAMGKLGGEPVSRSDLVDYAMTRALIRNELADDSLKQDHDDIKKSVYSHINRIYRGSLGKEHTGVFTKDHVYHKGFLQIGGFIRKEMTAGKSASEIYDYLVVGKFDPTNEQHVEEVKEMVKS